VPAKDLPQGRRYGTFGQDPGRHLVEQRLEHMVIGAVDEGDVHRRGSKELRSEQPTEPTANHDDAVTLRFA